MADFLSKTIYYLFVSARTRDIFSEVWVMLHTKSNILMNFYTQALFQDTVRPTTARTHAVHSQLPMRHGM
ncbi:unnamed protein product [Adineta ricciae]|uniref:Uncharacterized protein n=1 Tax=Adineta ricciae TaxID=249248 RepID=A0A814G649_ADIRI|nr:unnamed protein product [Adineta ricciae]